MKHWTGWMLVGAMTLAGGALAQQEATQQQQRPEQPPESTMQPGTGGSGMQHGTGGAGMQQDPKMLMERGMLPVPSDPQGFLSMLYAGNQMEVKLAQQAQQKASSKQVKEFARTLEQDHTRANQQITQFAQKQNMKLDENWKPRDDIGRALHDMDNATAEMLGRLEGRAFDMAFLTAMVGDHDKTIGKLQAAREQFGNDKELTAMVDKVLPVFMNHRERAYTLLGQEKPQMRQARMPPTPRR